MSIKEYSPYLFLSLSLLFLWGRQYQSVIFKFAWLAALILACICAVYVGTINLTGVLITFLVGVLAWCSINKNDTLPLCWICRLLFIASIIALALHIMPGFKSTLVIDHVLLTPGARSYRLYLNFDKTLIALFILGILYKRPYNTLSWTAALKWLWLLFPVIIGVVVLLALLTGKVKYEPKFIDGLWLWVWINLFFTCTVEEAIFRGLIQQQLTNVFSKKHMNTWIAVGIASLLFGLAHFAGGSMYIVFATVAGFGYGAVYKLTGRIEASIACHFSLNLVHILFFTYPAIK
jgi:membrane protease YdiL (CAAX protease family)